MLQTKTSLSTLSWDNFLNIFFSFNHVESDDNFAFISGGLQDAYTCGNDSSLDSDHGNFDSDEVTK